MREIPYSGTTAISRILVVVAVVVIVVIGVIAVAFLQPSKSSSTGSSSSTLATTSSSSSTVSNVTMNTRDSTTSVQSSSSLSTITSSSGAGPSGKLLMEFSYPGVLLASSDLKSMNYSITLASLGNVPTSLSLSATATQGLSAEISPENITLGSNQPAVMLSVSVASSTAPGNYQITLTASGAGETYNQTESIQVVKYLVVTIGSNFVPQNLTVSSGGTVTWLRLNGALSQYDNGQHDVDFSSGLSVVSPSLNQYDSWTYTFTQAGNYSYYCKYHPFMTGQIEVIS